MRLARSSGAAAVTCVFLLALAAPASASPIKKVTNKVTRSGKLRFNKPVALSSYSPLRTAVGTVYTLQGGEQPDGNNEWSGEPSIQVDAKGTVYIAGTCCVGPAAPVWYSNDDGKTFKELESPGHAREWGIGAEGDLAVDGDGHVFFIDTYLPGLLASGWSDNGETWDFTQPAVGVPPGMNDRPWYAATDDALYLYVNHASHTDLYSSTDGGKVWSELGPLSWAGDMMGQPFFPGHVSADAKSGTVWVTGVVNDGEDVIGSTVTTDGGQNWTEAVVSAPQRADGFSPVFTGTSAVDEAGNGYVTWSTTDAEGCDVYYAASTNEGKSWGKPVKVNTGSGCATFPWITAKDNGDVALAWYETPATKLATASERAVRSLTSPSAYGLDLALTYQDELPADARWFLHAALIDDAASKRPNINEEQVPTKTPVLEGPLGRTLWDFLQIDFGPDGRVHIAFVEKYQATAPETWYVSSKSNL